MIGAALFATLAKQKGSQVFAVSLKDVLEEQYRRGEIVNDAELKHLLPKEFRRPIHAFSRQEADKLPPRREYDYRIVLEENAKLGHAPLYGISKGELDILKVHLIKNLSKGFIEASKAPYAFPVLFVRKAGGGLRLCVDYRKLNAITRKDRYPLPLIKETSS